VLHGQYLNLGLYNLGTVYAFDEVNNFIKGSIDESTLIADHAEAYLSTLPEIVVTHFGNGHIKAVLDPVYNLLDDPPLFLE